MQKIGLFFNKQRSEAARIAQEVREWLRIRKKESIEITDEVENLADKNLDLIISIGGDGSLLKIASLLGGSDIPVLGVNAGSLGFLTNVKAKEVLEELALVVEGKYNHDKRSMLDVVFCVDEEQHNEKFLCLNEISINREGMTRFLDVTVFVDGIKMYTYGGDGVIVATPTGSTAYSLSAGGPFVYPSLQALTITPICAHSLRTRPLVVPHKARVEIKISCEYENDHAYVIFDGHEKREITHHSHVIITQSKFTFNLIKSSKRAYGDILREKF